MEAGTGKTRAAVELISSTNCARVLWVGPLRTLKNANGEVEKWGGMSMPVRYTGIESIGQSRRIYLDTLAFAEQPGDTFMVVDESLKIKNADAVRTKRTTLIGLSCQYRLILNGTPMTRDLLDLWPQMEFLSPKILRMTQNQFRDTFCKWEERIKYLPFGLQRRDIRIIGYANIEYLYSLIQPYIYECSLSLDIATERHTVKYHVSEECREAYKTVKEYYLRPETLDEIDNNVFLSMTQQMQHSYSVCPAKIEAVRKIFEKHGEKEGKTIIFCKFIDSQKTCRQEFPAARVLSYQREAFGLNLQAYSCIIFWDKTFDYGCKVQAEHRIYRTGQTETCRYYELSGDVPLERLIEQNNYKKIAMLEYFKTKTGKDLIKEL